MAHGLARDGAAGSRRSSGNCLGWTARWGAARTSAGGGRRWPWVGRGHDATVPHGRKFGRSQPVVGQRPDRVTGYAHAVTNQIAAAASLDPALATVTVSYTHLTLPTNREV